MNMQSTCGLLAAERPVPLEGVRIEARLSGACVEVTVTQRYRNTETVPVEAVYVFPLEEGAAVCGFAALVAGELIRGSVEERERAFERYDDAMERGDGAFLLDQERPNVFQASVGNLRAGEVAELQIRYVALATREGDAIRLAIPSTVSPRYVPDGPAEVGEPDGERVNPEHWPSVPYGLRLSVQIDGSDWKRVESPSHPVRVELRDSAAQVELASEDAALDRDFVLLVERREPQRPEVRVAREADGRRVAMVTFLPALANANQQGCEVLFLLDCSGSMEGDSIAQAKRALALCVRALGSEDSFNVMRFGSDHEALWNAPRHFGDDTLEQATRYIERAQADLGGTELLAPLRELLEHERARDHQRPRRVLLLTDGQVSNEHAVFELARKYAGNTRIFAFGIGAGASEHLIRGTARASRGAAELIFPGERIEPKVLRMFERVRMPVLDDAVIHWHGLRVEQAPARIPAVFSSDPLTVFARIEDGTSSELELVAGAHRWRIPIDLEHAEPGGPIPTLWAREAIRELDDTTSPRRGSAQQRPEADDKKHKRLVELGTRYQLLNSATSFVAVAQRYAANRTKAPAELRRIPVALTTGWGGGSTSRRRGSGALQSIMRLTKAPRVLPSRPAAPSAPGAPPVPMMFAQTRFMARGGEAPRNMIVLGQPSAMPQPRPPITTLDDLRGAEHVDHADRGSDQSDRVYELLMTQRAAGGFPNSQSLLACLGRARAAVLAAVMSSIDEHDPAHERVVITSIVIALLQHDFADHASEWQPAVNKANAWLTKQTTSFDATSVVMPARAVKQR